VLPSDLPKRRNVMCRFCSGALPIFAVFLGLSVSSVASGQPGLGSVTTQHGDRKFEAEMIVLEIASLFKTADDPTPEKVSIIAARGQTVCTPPAFTQEKKQLLDPTAYHHVKTNFPVSVEVEPAGKDSEAMIVKGQFAFALDALQSRMDPSAIYLPGAVWKVKAPVQIGYLDKQRKTKAYLKPGTYRIGPYGKFTRASDLEKDTTPDAKVDRSK
jgi:hypothetical protein